MAPAEYAFELVGGHLVLNWLNTRSWRRDPARDHERLPDVAAFDRWREAAREVHDLPVPGLAGPDTLVSLQSVRDDVLDWLDGAGEGVRYRRALAAALGRARLEAGLPARWQVAQGPDEALDTLVLATDTLLRSPEAARIRQCGLHECGWYFLDTTRNHSRRWCTPDECGNLARVRRYAARQADQVVPGDEALHPRAGRQ